MPATLDCLSKKMGAQQRRFSLSPAARLPPHTRPSLNPLFFSSLANTEFRRPCLQLPRVVHVYLLSRSNPSPSAVVVFLPFPLIVPPPAPLPAPPLSSGPYTAARNIQDVPQHPLSRQPRSRYIHHNWSSPSRYPSLRLHDSLHLSIELASMLQDSPPPSHRPRCPLSLPIALKLSPPSSRPLEHPPSLLEGLPLSPLPFHPSHRPIIVSTTLSLSPPPSHPLRRPLTHSDALSPTPTPSHPL
ncbi:hypothetical protein CONPUDRAFT_148362 [Coniophora puteana RWD-64-598 SS2]|uniref:Uncharacterized protein n=1 Tax=Coniophora puteana (strain RWD-64-598) TaxID=741705 RepID=A0A5M3N4U3_CONPW|nr:uncharacterized protein CONPUDRAFT_148362 [Coniophora puteana RWD-64-598 SS2]EIW86267.1 hypothetical protein CONPUDRAFT_148362 [Coniophora puteana RWD-64-598 SS2]